MYMHTYLSLSVGHTLGLQQSVDPLHIPPRILPLVAEDKEETETKAVHRSHSIVATVTLEVLQQRGGVKIREQS